MELCHKQACSCTLLFASQWWLEVHYISRSSSYTVRIKEAQITTDEFPEVESENSHVTIDLYHMSLKNQLGSSAGVSCVIWNVCRQSDWSFSGIGTSIMIERVWNLECTNSPETKHHKLQSEQHRRVVNLNDHNNGFPDTFQKKEWWAMTLQGSVTSLTPDMCTNRHISEMEVAWG